MNGVIKEQRPLKKQQDQELIITASYNSGSYICIIYVNNKMIDKKKFTVVH
jgi:hypothetical protein